jgi:hypothetical protein
MERLEQGHLHPLLQHPETKMSRPGIERGSPVSHSSKELFEHIILSLLGTYTYVDQNLYMAPPVHGLSLGWGPNFTCKFLLLEKNNHSIARLRVWITSGSPRSSTRAPRDEHVSMGIEPGWPMSQAGTLAKRYSNRIASRKLYICKEIFVQLLLLGTSTVQ